MRRLLRDQRGFSLAELLVVTAVLGFVMAAVIAIQQKGHEMYTYGTNRVEAQQNARVALDALTRELRSAQQIVTLGSASNVTFLDQNSVQVQYQLSGTDLNRTSGGTTATIIGGVQALTLTYCAVWNAVSNSCTTAAASASAVTVIRVELTARTEDAASTGSMGDRKTTVESAIRLRNVNAI
jgi:prepilin-type N-terminal cleavage/methylation domain-containing protein